MIRKLSLVLIISLMCLSVTVYASNVENSSEVEKFYLSLTENKDVYREYKNATLNIREKIKGTELKHIEKKLFNEYGIGPVVPEYFEDEIYFFASIYEDNKMVVDKHAIYNLDGQLLYSGHGRKAKKEAVNKGEFNGWSGAQGENELANEIPTRE